jgi:hypothetical protein
MEITKVTRNDLFRVKKNNNKITLYRLENYERASTNILTYVYVDLCTVLCQLRRTTRFIFVSVFFFFPFFFFFTFRRFRFTCTCVHINMYIRVWKLDAVCAGLCCLCYEGEIQNSGKIVRDRDVQVGNCSADRRVEKIITRRFIRSPTGRCGTRSAFDFRSFRLEPRVKIDSGVARVWRTVPTPGVRIAKGAKSCISRIITLQSNRKLSIIPFEIRRYCLLVHTI